MRKKREIICCIYKILSPTDSVYIGQTEDYYKRIREYIHCRCKNQRKLYNSIKKYGWDNHNIEIIHVLEEYNLEELNRLEKYYGDKYDCTNSVTGLNLKDPGGNRGKQSEESKKLIGLASIGNKNCLGKKHSEESRARRSERMRGHPFWGLRKFSEETKKKMSNSRKGKPMSKETKEKLSKSKTGTKMSPESIEKSRLSRMGKKYSNEHRKKISDSNKGKKWTKGQREKMIVILNSEERKQKTREIHTGKIVSDTTKEKLSKIILNTQNGVYYIGAKSAADSLNLNPGTLRNKLNNYTPNNTPFMYV